MNAINSLYGVGFLARFSYALARNPVLPLFALFLGAGPEAVGLAVGISTVTGIFFKMPSGALSDVIGRRRTMLAGLWVFAVLPFAYLFIHSYWALVVVRFLHGLATAVYGPVVMAVVADLAGEKKGEMLSWFSSVTIIGTLLGAPVGGFILHTLFGGDAGQNSEPGLWAFRTVYLVSGVLGVASLVLGWRILQGEERMEHTGGLPARWAKFKAGIREVLSDRRVVVVSSMEGIQNMTMGALEAFLPIYAVTVAGLNAFEAGLLWGAQIVVTMLSKPLMGRISDQYGRKPVIALGLIACSLSFMAIPWLGGFWTLLLAALVFGLGEAFVTSSSAALVADICKKQHYGAAMGTFGTIFDIGHASGPILSGLLVGALGYKAAFALLGVVLLAALPVLWRGIPHERREAGGIE
ncbi:MFS transporter [Megalodesulfovibrio gigas]|uniref:Putative major facilitator superfamily protein n=1 Tax=Megalodesulfovibrio gigas (strain ATCC 19364 / DSM 1382 / NCIMB 9332 / VKM B-1759) TaxID=1121448 RepID=T2GDD1_MEGG1|nr:MFS transporter [Megalodesulfovibrio gigas]AGW14323.1 putative major facilitator superfamily protein [Megalodesulfovibrio gigas DSM 1382 = ATCC 19364]